MHGDDPPHLNCRANHATRRRTISLIPISNNVGPVNYFLRALLHSIIQAAEPLRLRSERPPAETRSSSPLTQSHRIGQTQTNTRCRFSPRVSRNCFGEY